MSDGTFVSRKFVNSENKCLVVLEPSLIECDRLGYENMENCLLCWISSFMSTSVPLRMFRLLE